MTDTNKFSMPDPNIEMSAQKYAITLRFYPIQNYFSIEFESFCINSSDGKII